MWLMIFNMWHKKEKKISGYKKIHPFTKGLKTKQTLIIINIIIKVIIIILVLLIIVIMITIVIIIKQKVNSL